MRDAERSRHAIEAAEDALQFGLGNAGTAVGDAHRDSGRRMRSVSTVTLTSGPEYFTALSTMLVTAARISSGSPRTAAGPLPAGSAGLLRDVVQRAHALDGGAHDFIEIDAGEVELVAAEAEAAGAQDLLDGGEQTVAIVQHDAVELVALGVVDGAGLEGLEVEADGGDGSLQLMGDGVDEGVVLFVAADFPHQKDGVEHDAADDHEHEQHAQDQQESGAPVRAEPSRCRGRRMTLIRPTPRAMKKAMDLRRPVTSM